MKFEQQFQVAEPIGKVWAFFEQFEQVAQCIPGVKRAEQLDEDNVAVTVTQKLGPMSATFEARVHIIERLPRERIGFTSTGKAVKGAIGNFRASNSVELREENGHTHVTVSGEVALAGALGSVGQKVISRQAEKITVEFTRNLERVLSGETVEATTAPAVRCPAAAKVAAPAVPSGTAPLEAPGEFWPKLSATLSAAALVVSLLVLWQVS
ncbi:CoxG family protein [Halomonas sp. MES3-P3E]|uniref:CoxG family protein n=1 Tax=Halomonas sp. MES3-P3E TaxID=2058321 RepID=UPI000C3246E7|nr:SRPBCC domain-containing protein [Halomonas sp. MES3-P3E]PKG54221.1 carbon monoxide dehydrogenase [Halomonas sp. MES3-P3E]|tara:strand:- start:1576 stop:2205 length:630 start_codon:yes stop_codon:yes gene_type:complete